MLVKFQDKCNCSVYSYMGWDEARRVRVPSLLCVTREFLFNVHVWQTECHQLNCLQCIFRPI